MVISPQGGEIHGTVEWVDLTDLIRFYQIVKAWIEEVRRVRKSPSLVRGFLKSITVRSAAATAGAGIRIANFKTGVCQSLYIVNFRSK